MLLTNLEINAKLERLGEDLAFKCFNCGTCAAVCPLVHEHFPRRMIRYLQLGAEDLILKNADQLWRCLHCGLCSRTCPRQADPGEIVLGLKQFVIDHWRSS